MNSKHSDSEDASNKAARVEEQALGDDHTFSSLFGVVMPGSLQAQQLVDEQGETGQGGVIHRGDRSSPLLSEVSSIETISPLHPPINPTHTDQKPEAPLPALLLSSIQESQHETLAIDSKQEKLKGSAAGDAIDSKLDLQQQKCSVCGYWCYYSVSKQDDWFMTPFECSMCVGDKVSSYNPSCPSHKGEIQDAGSDDVGGDKIQRKRPRDEDSGKMNNDKVPNRVEVTGDATSTSVVEGAEVKSAEEVTGSTQVIRCVICRLKRRIPTSYLPLGPLQWKCADMPGKSCYVSNPSWNRDVREMLLHGTTTSTNVAVDDQSALLAQLSENRQVRVRVKVDGSETLRSRERRATVFLNDGEDNDHDEAQAVERDSGDGVASISGKDVAVRVAVGDNLYVPPHGRRRSRDESAAVEKQIPTGQKEHHIDDTPKPTKRQAKSGKTNAGAAAIVKKEKRTKGQKKTAAKAEHEKSPAVDNAESRASRRSRRSGGGEVELVSLHISYGGMDWDPLNSCWVPKQKKPKSNKVKQVPAKNIPAYKDPTKNVAFDVEVVAADEHMNEAKGRSSQQTEQDPSTGKETHGEKIPAVQELPPATTDTHEPVEASAPQHSKGEDENRGVVAHTEKDTATSLYKEPLDGDKRYGEDAQPKAQNESESDTKIDSVIPSIESPAPACVDTDEKARDDVDEVVEDNVETTVPDEPEPDTKLDATIPSIESPAPARVDMDDKARDDADAVVGGDAEIKVPNEPEPDTKLDATIPSIESPAPARVDMDDKVRDDVDEVVEDNVETTVPDEPEPDTKLDATIQSIESPAPARDDTDDKARDDADAVVEGDAEIKVPNEPEPDKKTDAATPPSEPPSSSMNRCGKSQGRVVPNNSISPIEKSCGDADMVVEAPNRDHRMETSNSNLAGITNVSQDCGSTLEKQPEVENSQDEIVDSRWQEDTSDADQNKSLGVLGSTAANNEIPPHTDAKTATLKVADKIQALEDTNDVEAEDRNLTDSSEHGDYLGTSKAEQAHADYRTSRITKPTQTVENGVALPSTKESVITVDYRRSDRPVEDPVGVLEERTQDVSDRSVEVQDEKLKETEITLVKNVHSRTEADGILVDEESSTQGIKSSSKYEAVASDPIDAALTNSSADADPRATGEELLNKSSTQETIPGEVDGVFSDASESYHEKTDEAETESEVRNEDHDDVHSAGKTKNGHSGYVTGPSKMPEMTVGALVESAGDADDIFADAEEDEYPEQESIEVPGKDTSTIELSNRVVPRSTFFTDVTTQAPGQPSGATDSINMTAISKVQTKSSSGEEAPFDSADDSHSSKKRKGLISRKKISLTSKRSKKEPEIEVAAADPDSTRAEAPRESGNPLGALFEAVEMVDAVEVDEDEEDDDDDDEISAAVFADAEDDVRIEFPEPMKGEDAARRLPRSSLNVDVYGPTPPEMAEVWYRMYGNRW